MGIRSKTDYGLIILADSRYNRHDKRSKLPKWMLQFLKECYLNLSTDAAMQFVKQFLRLMSQPIDQTALQSVLLTIKEVQGMDHPASVADKVRSQDGAQVATE